MTRVWCRTQVLDIHREANHSQSHFRAALSPTLAALQFWFLEVIKSYVWDRHVFPNIVFSRSQ